MPLALAASARSLNFAGASAPYHAVVSIKAERIGPLRVHRGKGLRDVAAHRAPGNRGALPSHVIEELGEVAREELRRVCAGAPV